MGNKQTKKIGLEWTLGAAGFTQQTVISKLKRIRSTIANIRGLSALTNFIDGIGKVLAYCRQLREFAFTVMRAIFGRDRRVEAAE